MHRIVIVICAASACALAASVSERAQDCSLHSFRCGNGQCARADALCDGVFDCADNTDEIDCWTIKQSASPEDQDFMSRRKRQAACRKNQWQCRDGSCIGFDGVCDGVRDCADGSDETHALCRNLKCQSNWFRCTYGACVDGTAPCNGVSECADGSDELQPRCLNVTDRVKGKFKCGDGSLIDTWNICDGVADCADGSDETVRACAGMQCPSHVFQCAYGACVDQGSDCDGKRDCFDGSDEDDVLCNRTGASSPTGATNTPVTTSTTTVQPLLCSLPPQPKHGRYTVAGWPDARPGDTFGSFYLNYTCNIGYGIKGENSVYCFNGYWSVSIPQCVRLCRIHPHPSVDYICPVPDTNGGTRPCNAYEPDGTRVVPNCRSPNYYSPQALSRMTCVEGSWDYIATCLPECGRETPKGHGLIIDGRPAERGELPWHVGVYRKDVQPYLQICGGSIISTTIVVSAAHCFWSESTKMLQPSSLYAVASGKLYRPWNNPLDLDAQMSEVAEIKVPTSFRGAQNNYQSDIALLMLSTPVTYQTYVRPVCVDFDVYFSSRQLQPERLGKVAGWGYMTENGTSSPTLKTVNLPYLNFTECLARVPEDFREYITSDKICAGYTNGTALCKGDSGGGLVFPENERGVTRYYLRGVVSTAPNNENACNAYAITSFTQINWHEHFIKENFATIPL